MLDRALHHLPGIGPERLRRLDEAGIRSWGDVCGCAHPPPGLHLGARQWDAVRREAECCERARQARDLRSLVSRLDVADRWRILAERFPDASFTDIETTGLSWLSSVTVIALWHRGRCHAFVRGENLDAFLDLLDETDLLISFNGSSFDVPRILRAFSIPELPCPHLDLRWICHREALRGGLKVIERQLGFQRSADLVEVDGAEAVRLWYAWEREHDAAARDRLERYCRADVMAMRRIAAELLRRKGCSVAADLAADASADAPLPEAARPSTAPACEEGTDTSGNAPQRQADFARLRRLLLESRRHSGPAIPGGCHAE